MWPWGYVIALAYFTLHMATATRYGYFRDALYYLACADHLAFGYVDQPPLFPFIAWIARHTLGTSLPRGVKNRLDGHKFAKLPHKTTVFVRTACRSSPHCFSCLRALPICWPRSL